MEHSVSLPEEWIKKYSLLFRVGEGKQNQLRLSKYHMSVIDELYEERSEEELVLKLEEKYETLKNFNNIREIPVPEHLKPILRPYQEHGFPLAQLPERDRVGRYPGR